MKVIFTSWDGRGFNGGRIARSLNRIFLIAEVKVVMKYLFVDDYCCQFPKMPLQNTPTPHSVYNMELGRKGELIYSMIKIMPCSL